MTLRVRNRCFNKEQVEYIAGVNVKGMVNQIYRAHNAPPEMAVKLAEEVLFYREWIEVIHDFLERKREIDLPKNLYYAFLAIEMGVRVCDSKIFEIP